MGLQLVGYSGPIRISKHSAHNTHEKISPKSQACTDPYTRHLHAGVLDIGALFQHYRGNGRDIQAHAVGVAIVFWSGAIHRYVRRRNSETVQPE